MSRYACMTRETASGFCVHVLREPSAPALRRLCCCAVAPSFRRRQRRWMPSLIWAPNDSEWSGCRAAQDCRAPPSAA
eukprot:2258490-Prymnesium_polylepis.1